jgi:hypothetical protein
MDLDIFCFRDIDPGARNIILDKRINRNVLKQVIIETRNFIRKIPREFIERGCFRLPENVKKVIIFHVVRRSGKTYLLYHSMREKPLTLFTSISKTNVRRVFPSRILKPSGKLFMNFVELAFSKKINKSFCGCFPGPDIRCAQSAMRHAPSPWPPEA